MTRRYWTQYQVTPIPTPKRPVVLYSGDWSKPGWPSSSPENRHTFTSTRAMMRWIRNRPKNAHLDFKTVRDPCGAWLEVLYTPKEAIE